MEFTTKRLTLRPWKLSDAEDLYTYAKDPLIGPAAGWAPHSSVEESEDIIKTIFSGPLMWAICLKEDNKAIGSIGFLIGGDSNIPGLSDHEAEIGYWIGRPFWGKGLMPEAVRCLMKHSFDKLGITTLWSGYFEGNTQSQKVQEKCGFRYSHTVKDKPWPLLGETKNEIITSVTKEQWADKGVSNRTVLLVLLNEYADWECAYLAPALKAGVAQGRQGAYEVKTMAPTLNEIVSLGGLHVVPDYSFSDFPEDFSALILIGGDRWDSPEAKGVEPIVRKAISLHKVVGAICNGASFLASCGFLNDVKHTGNGLDQLKQWGGVNYTNESGYTERQAVSDKNIVTANGTGSMELSREILKVLKADTDGKIASLYHFMKFGFYKE